MNSKKFSSDEFPAFPQVILQAVPEDWNSIVLQILLSV